MITKMTNGPSHSPIAIQKMNQKFVKETSLALVWLPCTEAWWSEAPFYRVERNDSSKTMECSQKNNFPKQFFLLLFDLLFFPALEWMLLKDGVVERNHPTKILDEVDAESGQTPGKPGFFRFEWFSWRTRYLDIGNPCSLGWLYPQTNIAGWNIPIFNVWVTFFSQLC